MSRIGKQPITLPTGVSFTQAEQYEVKGPKGTLMVPVFANISVTQEGEQLVVQCKNPAAMPQYGLLRALLMNAVTGVSNGWSRALELHGVGMRANVAGSTLNLSLGFSHPVQVQAPEGVSFTVVKNVITVSGADKQLVGETAAQIRRFRPPEPYKGKGIRYSDEYVRRKAGKAGKATATK